MGNFRIRSFLIPNFLCRKCLTIQNILQTFQRLFIFEKNNWKTVNLIIVKQRFLFSFFFFSGLVEWTERGLSSTL